MNLFYLTSEASPYAKTGGLADVAGALPRYLARRGHRVSVIMPYYRAVREGRFPIRPSGITLAVPMEGGEEKAEIYETRLEKRGRVYFVGHEGYFDREGGLYGDGKADHPDNAARFTFFNKVAAELIVRLGGPVEIVHCNDWQTALFPIYRRLWYGDSETLGRARTVLTIHNLAYQGSFPPSRFGVTGLPESLYTPHGGLEFWGKVNLLKGGLFYADVLTTVSRRYAEEIRTAQFGAGLDGVLRARAGALHGIPNGIDTEIWNPETDRHIPSHFSREKIEGKRRCKRSLQKECRLAEETKIPLVGMISRLADQKGLDLVVELLDRIVRERFQFVLLGTGDPKYHKILRDLARRRRKRLSVHLRFDNPLAHRIEAGADIFLMPSRYEPCGLNQLYSLRYGTVPVVHATGGLADTVTDCTDEALRDGSATGFAFDDYSAGALEEAVRRAFRLFRDRRAWNRLVRSGMSRDWSWERSAAAYERLYEKTLHSEPAPAAR